MRDNSDTEPNIIKIRKAGNVARLNMELAISRSQDINANSNSANASTTASAVAAEIRSGGGTIFVPPTRCFTGDTLIKSVTLFEIRDARVGDFVLGFDENRKRSLCRISHVFIHETTSFLKLKIGRKVLQITPEHLVYDGEDFKPIRDFKKGDCLFTSRFNPVKIRDIEEIVLPEPILVYNLETESHTYFANGFAVHNAKRPDEEL